MNEFDFEYNCKMNRFLNWDSKHDEDSFINMFSKLYSKDIVNYETYEDGTIKIIDSKNTETTFSIYKLKDYIIKWLIKNEHDFSIKYDKNRFNMYVYPRNVTNASESYEIWAHGKTETDIYISAAVQTTRLKIHKSIKEIIAIFDEDQKEWLRTHKSNKYNETYWDLLISNLERYTLIFVTLYNFDRLMLSEALAQIDPVEGMGYWSYVLVSMNADLYGENEIVKCRWQDNKMFYVKTLPLDK